MKKLFKDSNDKIHEIEEGYEHLLPAGCVEITQAEAEALLAPTPEEAKAQYVAVVAAAVQSAMDAEAQANGYDNVFTAVTYAGETAVTKFSDDGKSFRKWRSLVWKYCYDALAQYETEHATYVTDKATYDAALAQYQIDILADPPLDPAPVEPVAPVEPIPPTIDEIVLGMPARV